MISNLVCPLCEGRRKIDNSFIRLQIRLAANEQRVAVETSTRSCTILYVRVRRAIALHSSSDCHPAVLIMFVTLESLL